MSSRNAGGDEANRGEDEDLLALLGEGNEWLRGVLCTLARRGAGFRRRHPARAVRLVDTVSRWPVVKGGQFLFDLMEWEDFMIDGSPPPVVPSALTGGSWVRIAKLLRDAQRLVDPQARWTAGLFVNVAVPGDKDLPPIDPGLHLYSDVVLGVIASARPALRPRRGPGTS